MRVAAKRSQNVLELPDVLLECDPAPGLYQVLPARLAILRIVQQEIRQFSALLNQINPRESFYFFLKSRCSQ